MATVERPNPSNGGLAAPHNLEAEQSVLGAILLTDRSMYGLVIEQALRGEDFYREQHRVIFAAMVELYEESRGIDAVTVTEHLRQRGGLEEAGGEAAIHALSGAVPAAGNVLHYARIVKDNALLRRLLRTTYDIQASVSEHDGAPRDLVERAERAMLEVAHDDRQKDFRSIEEVLHEEIDKLQALSAGDAGVTGTPSGYEHLDAVTGGFQPGNLIIIAARPGMGKSCLVTNIAENTAVKDGTPVALFSLEMSESELAQRFIASQSSTRLEDLRKGKVAEGVWPKVLKATNHLAQAPLYIDDSSDVGLLEIRAKARRLHAQHRLGLIIVDYIQLMRPDGRIENRVEQIGQMSRGLKILARELDVPVIALSQLNRSVEQRGGDHIPLLSDLRESGSLEQDSDLVMFIWRDEYYNKDESERPGEADLIIAKHRNGPLDKITLTFQAQYPRFMTLVPEERFT